MVPVCGLIFSLSNSNTCRHSCRCGGQTAMLFDSVGDQPTACFCHDQHNSGDCRKFAGYPDQHIHCLVQPREHGKCEELSPTRTNMAMGFDVVLVSSEGSPGVVGRLASPSSHSCRPREVLPYRIEREKNCGLLWEAGNGHVLRCAVCRSRH
jgi:hypothetical protein